ncbi:MAG: putative hydrolase of the HAD superfamily [Chloroflexi bacterium]|nr:MAG: putative hydrolase of the HAD superfamily [Chloroflexota bacterium]MBA4376082.1 hypothetical protein [Anaerolinea sp.]
MGNSIKAVIWDMGGVILRSEDPKPRQELADKYAITLDSMYALVFKSESAQRATVGIIDETEHWKEVGKTLGISGDELCGFQDQFWAGDRLDQELIEFIRSLKTTHKTALLSNAWSGARDVLTTSKPCLDAFQFSVFSCEVGLAKPDPAIYREILTRVGVEPREAIFVDDVQENIDAANGIGIHGVRFSDSMQAKNEVNLILAQTA